MEIDFNKVCRGLELRLKLAKHAVTGKGLPVEFNGRKDSLARDYFSEYRAFGSTVFRGTHKDVLVARFLMSRPSLAEQIELFNDLSQQVSCPYFGRLLIGKQVSSQLDNLTDIDSSIDYSLYVQSFIFSDPKLIDAKTLAEFRQFSIQLLKTFGIKGDIRRTEQLLKIAGLNFNPEDGSHFELLLKSLSHIKSSYWYLFGVDSINTLIRLVCPEQLALYSPGSSEIAALKLFGFHSIYEKYRSLFRSSRIFRGYSQLQGEGIPPADFFQLDRVEQSLRTSTPLKNAQHPDSDLFPLLSKLAQSIEIACNNQDYHFTYDRMANLYALDPSVVPYLNWKLLYEIIPADTGIYSIPRCFTEMLFLQKDVAKLNPELQGARNLGSLMGALDVFVSSERSLGKTQRQFWRGIHTSLPRRASDLFINSLLRPSYLERIENRLPPQQTEFLDPNDIPERDEKSITLRLSLATEARSIKAISIHDYNKIVEEERSNFTLRWYQKEFAKGRIRIPWRLLKTRIDEFVYNLYLDDHRSVDRRENKTLDLIFLESVIRRLISPFLEDILFEGPAAFDRVLSDNLRHRVIYPRYNSAFLTSIRHGGFDIPADFGWKLSRLEKIIGPSAEPLHFAKHEVDTTLKEYIDFWLTIRERGQLYNTLSENVIELIKKYSSEANSDSRLLAQKLFDCIQLTFCEFIQKGNVEFKKKVAPSIENIVGLARKNVYEISGNGMVVDALANSISESNKTVSGWIQVVTDTQDFQAFTLVDIVSLETAFIHLATIDETNISLSCFNLDSAGKKSQTNDIEFDGQYFQVINSIIHNVVSNATRYSGYGDSVPLELQAISSRTSFTIVASNKITPEARLKALDRLPVASKLARAEIDLPRGADQNSGFDKIRMACAERSISKVDIDIGPFNKRSKVYEVTVTINRCMEHND